MATIKAPRKVLLMGLDNSGKTTILMSLKDDSNLLTYLSLKPTRGLAIVPIDNPEYDLHIWDFGGQDIYREDYLNQFNKYTENVNTLIYVIDVQDLDRYDLSIKYFQRIIKLLKKDKILLQISIFLHKYDPNLKKKENFISIDEMIQSKLIDKISDIVDSDFKYDIYKTSIYTIFEKNLVKKNY